MDRNDQAAIEDLFAKLDDVERNAPQRDRGAETFIRDQISRQPNAPYFMAQTIVVQNEALGRAEARIEELEQQLQSAPSRGGMFSETSGARGSASSGSVPRTGRGPETAQPPYAPQAGGGGFLAGAMQTALGVAGGVLLGNAIGGLFGSHGAKAADSSTDGSTEKTDSNADDEAADSADYEDDDGDFGGDDFDGGGFDA